MTTNKIMLPIAVLLAVVGGVVIGVLITRDNTPEPVSTTANQIVANQNTQPPTVGKDPTSIPPPATSEAFGWQLTDVVLGPSVGNEPDNNVLMADVIRLADGSYRMYYDAGLKGSGLIKYADSVNGKTNWLVGGTALAGGSDPADDDYVIGGPRVLQLPDGSYRMYYRATPDHVDGQAPSYATYVATSSDGQTFTKAGVVIPNQREDAATTFTLVGHGAFYQLEDETFAGFFSGNVAGDQGPSDLFFTTSADGISWNEPTVLYRGVHDPTVVKTDTGFVLVAMHLKDWVGVTTSPDGLAWPASMESADIRDSTGQSIDLNMIGDLNLAVGLDGKLILHSNYNNGQERGIAQYDILQ